MSFLVISGNKVLRDSSSTPSPATVEVDVSTGKIARILDRKTSSEEYPKASKFIDAGDHIVMAGIVDCHVHINQPGRTEWEGFHTATCAAAAGGVTTLIDMPLNSIPPTTTVPNFHDKVNSATNPEPSCFVNVGFYGGVIPDHQDHIVPLVDAGVFGFKCFMCDSGVDEFPGVSYSDIQTALKKVPSKSFLMFHAEVTSHCGPHKSGDPKLYSTFLASRPPEMENEAIRQVIELCRESKKRCHIVHLSSAQALPLIKAAKAEGLPLTVETCFHYLYFTAETIPDAKTQYKCCPPIRSKSNQDELWKGLLDGTIDYVVSDHSPCTAELKIFGEGDFLKAWGGISSVQFGLGALWTAGSSHGITVQSVAKWLCENTAKQVGLSHRKGKLAQGYDADITIWDPNANSPVQKSQILFKNKFSAYEGVDMKAKVVYTIVGGNLVYDSAKGVDKVPKGSLLFSNKI